VTCLGTASETGSKRPLDAGIPRETTWVVPEENAWPRYDHDLFFGFVSTHVPLVVCLKHTEPTSLSFRFFRTGRFSGGLHW
jgi:hypothetical protein